MTTCNWPQKQADIGVPLNSNAQGLLWPVIELHWPGLTGWIILAGTCSQSRHIYADEYDPSSSATCAAGIYPRMLNSEKYIACKISFC